LLETLDYISSVIRLDLLIGFGLYSIIFFLVRLFYSKKVRLNNFDYSATRITIYLGVIFCIFWALGCIIYYFQVDDQTEKLRYTERMFGKYWFGFWLQPIIWILLTQLLRINFLRKNLLFRIIISLSFVLTLERITIILTSLHRDYLPSSWTMYSGNWNFGLGPFDVFLGLFFKIFLFVLITSMYHFGKSKVKTLYNNTYK